MLPGNSPLLRRSKIGAEANHRITLLTGLLPMAYFACFLIQHNIVYQVVTVPTVGLGLTITIINQENDTDSSIGI